jgi:hypothetical protein
MTGFYPPIPKKYSIMYTKGTYAIVRIRDYTSEEGPHVKQITAERHSNDARRQCALMNEANRTNS